MITAWIAALPLLGTLVSAPSPEPDNGLFSKLPEAYRPVVKPGAVAVTVNGQPIRQDELAAWLWTWRGSEALEDAVQYVLVEQDAAKKGVHLGQPEVDQEFARRLQTVREGLQGRTLDEVLAEQGYSLSRLYVRLRVELLTNKVLELSFDPARHVKISTIVFSAGNGSLDALQAAIKTANEAHEKLVKGTAWSVVLNESNAPENVRQNDGLIGWRNVDLFPEAIREQLANAAPGTILKPVQTSNGIQIFRVERPGKGAAGKDLEDLKAVYLQTARTPYWQGLRTSAKIE